MHLPEFELERFQSLYEHHVDYNLSESGVHPLTVRDLLAETDRGDWLLETRLGYAQTNGPEPLRRNIASMYPPAKPDNVLVTNGTIEANFLCAWRLLSAGDELVYMLPNYVQLQGMASSFGVRLKGFQLNEANNWRVDFNEVAALVSDKTKVIALCNPNNPTGSVLSKADMARFVDLAASVGAWLLIDEIYRGTEHSGELSPTFYDMYDRVIVTSSLSKAYGLPGLRIGWIVAPASFIEEVWSYKDYSSITAATLSYELATRALEPATRQRIMGRNRALVVNNLALLQSWIDTQKGLSLTPPVAGAMAFIRYAHPLDSALLVEKIHKEKSVLIVPGAHFGMENFLRLGYGLESNDLKAALQRITEVLEVLD